MAARLSKKRIEWFREHQCELERLEGSLLDRAYELFLRSLSIQAEEAPIVSRNSRRLVIHSRNFCPTLEACVILDLDARTVCARATEQPMDVLLKQLDPRLSFSRNYEAIRPHAEYCEEFISITDNMESS